MPSDFLEKKQGGRLQHTVLDMLETTLPQGTAEALMKSFH